MDIQELQKVAETIVADGKGILAADESDGTIKKRFDSIGVDSTEEARRSYRELLFTTEGAEEFIGGVILFDETIRQTTARRSRSCSSRRESFPASRSTRAPSPSRSPKARPSPRVWTVSASGSRSIASSARGSRSGAP